MLNAQSFFAISDYFCIICLLTNRCGMWYNERLARGANEGWLRILANPLMPQILPHSESFFSFHYFSRNSLQNNFAAEPTKAGSESQVGPLCPIFCRILEPLMILPAILKIEYFYHSAKNSTIPASVA